MSAASRKLLIDEYLFVEAFGRDINFYDTYSQSVHLDLETGDLLWVYDDDENAYMEAGIPPEENAGIRQRVETSPDRYLEIPGLDHGDHHDILREFLNSESTDDEDARLWASQAYFGSIGGWKQAVDDESIVQAYYDFRDLKTTEMAEEFLRSHGIEPDWK